MSKFEFNDDSVVLSVSGEIICEDGNAEFHPVIRISGCFPKAFGERFMEAFSSRFTDFVFMINEEINSYGVHPAAPEVSDNG